MNTIFLKKMVLFDVNRWQINRFLPLLEGPKIAKKRKRFAENSKFLHIIYFISYYFTISMKYLSKSCWFMQLKWDLIFYGVSSCNQPPIMPNVTYIALYIMQHIHYTLYIIHSCCVLRSAFCAYYTQTEVKNLEASPLFERGKFHQYTIE